VVSKFFRTFSCADAMISVVSGVHSALTMVLSLLDKEFKITMAENDKLSTGQNSKSWVYSPAKDSVISASD